MNLCEGLTSTSSQISTSRTSLINKKRTRKDQISTNAHGSPHTILLPIAHQNLSRTKQCSIYLNEQHDMLNIDTFTGYSSALHFLYRTAKLSHSLTEGKLEGGNMVVCLPYWLVLLTDGGSDLAAVASNPRVKPESIILEEKVLLFCFVKGEFDCSCCWSLLFIERLGMQPFIFFSS